MPKKDNTNCCVYGCSTSRRDANLSANPFLHFHHFPPPGSGMVFRTNKMGIVEAVDRRKAWDNILLRNKPSTNSLRVCSKHFESSAYKPIGRAQIPSRLKPTAIPTLNLPQKSLIRKNTVDKQTQDRFDRRDFMKRKNIHDELPEPRPEEHVIGGHFPHDGNLSEIDINIQNRGKKSL